MNKIKLYWIALPVFSGAIAAIVYAQVIPGNIEAERIRPQANIEFPKVQTDPNAVDYFFEPSASERFKPGEPYPLVHMRIPKRPYFDRNSSNGPARKYEIYIPMFYPNFSGLADEENAECRVDAKRAVGNFGWCRRELTVGFGFVFRPPMSEELALSNLENDLQLGYIVRANDKSKYGGLQLVGVRGRNEERTTYYVSQDGKGHRQFVISCLEYAVSPACRITFRATKSPYIFINLTFVNALLPQWKDVITATRQKVDSMIVQTYQLPSKE